MKVTPEQVKTISKGDPEIEGFIQMLLAHIEKLETRVRDLERQLGQNSQNSSKPPSSDGFRKPTNLRKPGGKKGAPDGHSGHTLRFTDRPDEVVTHHPTVCTRCFHSLEEVPGEEYERRQVVDFPPPRVATTEHRAFQACCPCCGNIQQAAFPSRVSAPTQYGDGFVALTNYFSTYQMLPLERIAQLFADLTGLRPSEATLLAHLHDMADALEPAEETIRERLLRSPVVHVDETGVQVAGKKQWMHVVSNAAWTLLGVDASRGSKGTDSLKVLPTYLGKVVHDCLTSYFKTCYLFWHILCNAHLVRECQGIVEYDGHQWAAQMKTLLLESWESVKASRLDGVPLPEERIAAIRAQYAAILAHGKTEWEQDVVREKTGPQGRKSKSKAANLGERFLVHQESILRFLWDAEAPFDNNQAERDLRMVKVKMKVSGTFRTGKGADQFACTRSVISTLMKQGRPVLASLKSALGGTALFS